MKERPILFSAPMIIADLEGRKTQTRRTRGLAVINKNPDDWRFDGWIRDAYRKADVGKCVWSPVGNQQYDISGSIKARCPFGEVGDRLWFKETWSGDSVETVYRATHHGPPIGGKWHPSLLMPRNRARTVREIVSIRAERLQDISEADAKAEGVERNRFDSKPVPGSPTWRDYSRPHGEYGYGAGSAKGSYSSLWESINGPDSWDANPWVWVVEFKRVDA